MAFLRAYQSSHWRFLTLLAFFLVLFAAVIVRIFSLAIVEHRQYALAADRQHELTVALPPLRGGIFAEDAAGQRHPFAIQKTFYTLEAAPKDIVDPTRAAHLLAGILTVPESEIFAKVSKQNDPNETLARKLEDDAASQIRNLNLDGINLVAEARRVYPQGTLAASLVGFVRYENGEEGGEYGIERQYESYLKGERGFFEGERDTAGYWIALGKRILNPPVNGEDVVLTIDPNVQFKVEEELDALMKKWQGESALAVVLEPKTGKILALASRPTFDPNAYSREKDFSVFQAPAIESQFELGSVFKPITMAAGIDAGVITASSTYSDPGTVHVDGFTISNFDGKSYGVQTMTQVLEKSLNTGAVFAGEQLGKNRFLDALRRFGFGERTGVNFPGEAAGDISNLESGRDAEFATASFGQGIAVSPLQLATAIAAIANHGVLLRPYLVEKVADANGSGEVHRPEEVRRVVSTETAETVTKMLVSVVEHGFDNHAAVKGYSVAGKTGTAQIPKKDGKGYSDEFIHTFAGYAPAFDPRFLVIIQVNKPKGVSFASTSLTPSFHNIAEFMLNYYEVSPDRK